MTREEAKQIILRHHIAFVSMPDEVIEAVNYLMKEHILDKVRAEIDNSLSDGMIHKKTVLGIIDKYNAECEEKK